jgi:hypothetical protein
MSRIPKIAPRELAPEGAHSAAVVQIIDLGTQESRDYGPRHKLQIAYELVEEKTTEGAAMVVYRQYTFTSSPKGTLMKDLRAAFGVKDQDIEMDDLLGKPCMVTVEWAETDAGTFANVAAVSMVPKGTKVKKPTEELKSLYLDETFDQEVFDSLPDFLREKIAASKEYEEVMTPRLKKKSTTLNGKAKAKAKAMPEPPEEDDEDEGEEYFEEEKPKKKAAPVKKKTNATARRK